MDLRLANIHTTLAGDDFDKSSMNDSEIRFLDLIETLDASDKKPRFHRFVISVAPVAAVITLIAGIDIFQPHLEPRIATITSTDGRVRWTDDGGHVFEDLEPGRELAGGTLESLPVDALTTFEFRDGSTVTLTGLSAFTISDDGQKELRLGEGNLPATGEAQSGGEAVEGTNGVGRA